MAQPARVAPALQEQATAPPTAKKLLTSLAEFGVSHQERCFALDLLSGDLFHMQKRAAILHKDTSIA